MQKIENKTPNNINFLWVNKNLKNNYNTSKIPFHYLHNISQWNITANQNDYKLNVYFDNLDLDDNQRQKAVESMKQSMYFFYTNYNHFDAQKAQMLIKRINFKHPLDIFSQAIENINGDNKEEKQNIIRELEYDVSKTLYPKHAENISKTREAKTFEQELKLEVKKELHNENFDSSSVESLQDDSISGYQEAHQDLQLNNLPIYESIKTYNNKNNINISVYVNFFKLINWINSPGITLDAGMIAPLNHELRIKNTQQGLFRTTHPINSNCVNTGFLLNNNNEITLKQLQSINKLITTSNDFGMDKNAATIVEELNFLKGKPRYLDLDKIFTIQTTEHLKYVSEKLTWPSDMQRKPATVILEYYHAVQESINKNQLLDFMGFLFQDMSRKQIEEITENKSTFGVTGIIEQYENEIEMLKLNKSKQTSSSYNEEQKSQEGFVNSIVDMGFYLSDVENSQKSITKCFASHNKN